MRLADRVILQTGLTKEQALIAAAPFNQGLDLAFDQWIAVAVEADPPLTAGRLGPRHEDFPRRPGQPLPRDTAVQFRDGNGNPQSLMVTSTEAEGIWQVLTQGKAQRGGANGPYPGTAVSNGEAYGQAIIVLRGLRQNQATELGVPTYR